MSFARDTKPCLLIFVVAISPFLLPGVFQHVTLDSLKQLTSVKIWKGGYWDDYFENISSRGLWLISVLSLYRRGTSASPETLEL